MIARRERGFTLIELMIVMAVIAILVGIALPRFKGMKDEANVAKSNGELRALKTALESYYIHQSPHAYPATTTTVCATNLLIAKPRLIEVELYDPFGATSTTEYNYSRSANGKYYVVFSAGPDEAYDITGISDAGVLAGTDDDDPYSTNGSGF